MDRISSVSVNDLERQFQEVYELSPIGFQTALNVLDQNADRMIDDAEIFDVFGVERSCQEYMVMLGLAAYPQLTPQTLYYGQCPLSDEPAVLEIDSCPTAEANEQDAQVALNFLMSLSFYLRSNEAVIQAGESDSLYYQCSPQKNENDYVLSVPDIENKGIRDADNDGHVLRDLEEILADPNAVIKSVGYEEVRFSDSHPPFRVKESNMPIIEKINSDPQLRDYFESVCDKANAGSSDPANANTTAANLMFMDSLSGDNPLDQYLADDDFYIILDCSEFE